VHKKEKAAKDSLLSAAARFSFTSFFDFIAALARFSAHSQSNQPETFLVPGWV